MKIEGTYENLLKRFTEMSREILGENLVGVYLHGSAAMGCFHPEKSDLDLLLVVAERISKQSKLEFMQEVVKLNEEAPAKGIEMSIIRKESCHPFVYPTPFELHFSAMHYNWFKEKPEEYVEKMNGMDWDLAAHITIIHHCGVVLYGAPVREVFGEIRKTDYIDSIWRDIEAAEKEITSDPMYLTLNLCRVLGYLKEGLVLSKQSGGEWGLRSVPQEYHALLREALQCYASDKVMEADSDLAVKYAEYMLHEIGTYRPSGT